jgi:cytochrome c-type biogenesis protein
MSWAPVVSGLATAGDPAAGVGVFAAVVAGLVSFLSPCVLPLVPGYLSAVVGVSPAELERAGARRVLAPSLLFVASFSVIFILLGLGATAIGSAFAAHRETVNKVAAALIVALGLFFVVAPFVTRLNREWHVEGLMRRAGRGGPFVAGAAFAVAWTPCVGPTLGAILSAAALSHSELHGAVLLAFYSAGLAVPFLFTSLAFTRMTLMFGYVKRHFGAIIVIGGAVLIAMGVLIWTGKLTQLNADAQSFLGGLGLDFFSSV